MADQKSKGVDTFELERRKIELEEQLLDLQEMRIDVAQKRIDLELRKLKILLKSSKKSRSKKERRSLRNEKGLSDGAGHDYEAGLVGTNQASDEDDDDHDEDVEDESEDDEVVMEMLGEKPSKRTNISPKRSTVAVVRSPKPSGSTSADDNSPFPPFSNKPAVKKFAIPAPPLETGLLTSSISGSREKIKTEDPLNEVTSDAVRRRRMPRRGSAPVISSFDGNASPYVDLGAHQSSQREFDASYLRKEVKLSTFLPKEAEQARSRSRESGVDEMSVQTEKHSNKS